MFSPPKNMLVDAFGYQEYLGIDRNHVAGYGEEQTVKNARIDRAAVYTRDGSESSKRADATVYCFKAHTEPFPNFKRQSKVRFDGEDYTVTDVRPLTEPFSSTITAYELEVIQ